MKSAITQAGQHAASLPAMLGNLQRSHTPRCHWRRPATFTVQPVGNLKSLNLAVTRFGTLTCQAVKALQPAIGLSISPLPSIEQQTSNQHAKPFLLLLPDLDGVGATSSRTWPQLAKHFDMHVLRLEGNFTSSFPELVSYVTEYLRVNLQDAAPERPTYILGEGFGGLLALAVSLACNEKYVSRLILVNPCTCVEDVPIRRLGPLLARLPHALWSRAAPLAIAPLLGGSPTDLLGHVWAQTQSQPSGWQQPYHMAAAAMEALISAVEQLQLLARHLPPDTLTARLALLDEALQHVHGRLHEVEARVMILAGGRDALLPSVEEARHLVKQLPRAFYKVFPNAGHALLLDPSIKLIQVLQEEGFLIDKRRFTSPVRPGKQVVYGVPGPVELPTKQEVERSGRQLTAPLRRLCSPVFFSTLADGSIVEGLAGLETEYRPLLFVGNHQLYALDMNVMVEEVYLQKGILLRGLAHPALFRQTFLDNTQPADASSRSGNEGVYGNGSPHQPQMNNAVPLPANLKHSAAARQGTVKGRQLPQGAGRQPALPFNLGDIYRTNGAVVVTPTAFYKLLAANEAVLLYPGGVREGFKRRNEKYELFWPEKSEFVRMAARHNAHVIPISAVGWEDCVDIIMDSDEIAAHPWLGPTMQANSSATPKARLAESELDEMFIPPLIAPKAAARLYFLFGRPIPLNKALCNDRQAADHQYFMIKTAVKDGIHWLLQHREHDPYKSVVRRVMYESMPLRTRRQAPTFPLEKNAAVP